MTFTPKYNGAGWHVEDAKGNVVQNFPAIGGVSMELAERMARWEALWAEIIHPETSGPAPQGAGPR